MLILSKKISVIFLTTIVITCLCGCETTKPQVKKTEAVSSVAKKELKISKVSFSHKKIDLNQEKALKIRFYLPKKAAVAIDIFNEEHFLIKTITIAHAKPGLNESVWQMTDNENRIVSSGVYLIKIKANFENGQEAVFDPSYETGGKSIAIENFGIEEKTNDVIYSVPKASRVRIRMGLKDGGALLKTLLDWEPRVAGEQKELWDGKDDSKEMLLVKNPQLYLVVDAFTLSDNSLIIQGSKPAEYLGEASSPKLMLGKHKHAQHLRSICHEPKIEMHIGTKEFKEETPVIKDAVPLVIKIAKEDIAHITNSRYEIIFFIDNVFLFEDEEGYSPFTYVLSTKSIPNGEHLLTANIVSYDDHIGVVTKKVIVNN